MVRKNHILRDITVCRQVNSYWRFGGTCCLSAVYQLTDSNTPHDLNRGSLWTVSLNVQELIPLASSYTVFSGQEAISFYGSQCLLPPVLKHSSEPCSEPLECNQRYTLSLLSLHNLSCYPSICGCFKRSLPPSCTVKTFSLPSYLFCWYCI